MELGNEWLTLLSKGSVNARVWASSKRKTIPRKWSFVRVTVLCRIATTSAVARSRPITHDTASSMQLFKLRLVSNAFTGPTIGTWRLGFRKALAARKRKFPSVKDLPVPERNLVDSVSETCDHGTLSGTTNGVRPGSANALSQVTVAQAWGSWLPWTITTTGSDSVQTYMQLPNHQINLRSTLNHT